MLSIFLAIRKLLEGLGLWQSEQTKKLASIREDTKKYETQLKAQQDKLKDLKREIENSQESILVKEKEMNSQTGKIREITQREIASLFKQFESYSGQRDLIFRNIDSITTLINKLKEYATALESDLNPDAIADLTSDLLDNLQEIKAQDLELTRLEKVGYVSAETNEAEVQTRLAQLHSGVNTEKPKEEKAEEAIGPKFASVQTQPLPLPSDAEVRDLEAKLAGLHQSLKPEEAAEKINTESASSEKEQIAE